MATLVGVLWGLPLAALPFYLNHFTFACIVIVATAIPGGWQYYLDERSKVKSKYNICKRRITSNL